jgi:hypothetical protein
MADFNNAGPHRSFDPIPEGTVVPVEMTIRRGDAGEGGWLRRSKDGRSEALDCELTVVEGEHAKRKIWTLLTLEGSTPGHAQAGDISRRILRAILESVRGIKPSDKSEEAKKARVAEYHEFDGLRFLIRVGVEPARDGYKAKNTISRSSHRTKWAGVPSRRFRSRPLPLLPVMATRRCFSYLQRPQSPSRIGRRNELASSTEPGNRARGRMAAQGDGSRHRCRARRSQAGGAIPPGAPVGRLSDTEIGWIVAAVLFGWIRTRAEQATSEGLDTELAIRATGYDPDPWDAGAIAAILPDLGEMSDIDWSKPVGAWPRETMIRFLTTVLSLIRKAVIARDLGGGTITRKTGAAQIARQANAAAGGPLMTPDELDDPIL